MSERHRRLSQIAVSFVMTVLVASAVPACAVGAGQTQESQSGGTVTTTTSDIQPDLTLDEAKQHTVDQIEAFMAYVPDDSYTIRYTADEPMHVLSCQKDGYYYWPGNGQFVINDGYDTQDIMNRIETDYQAKDGWQVEWTTTPGGVPYLYLISPDTYAYYISPPTQKSKILNVAGDSPCFPAPPNFDIAKKY